MPGLAPFAMPLAALALGGGAMIDQNVQNKAAIKNSQNAQDAARQQVTQNQQTAQTGLNNYLGANPGPAQAGNQPGVGMTYAGANVPFVNQAQKPPAQNQLSPQVLALLSQMQQGGAPIA